MLAACGAPPAPEAPSGPPARTSTAPTASAAPSSSAAAPASSGAPDAKPAGAKGKAKGKPAKATRPATPPPAIAADPTFGEAGLATYRVQSTQSLSGQGNECAELVDVAEGPDGSLYVVGTFPWKNGSTLADCDAGVLKIGPDGHVDASFGEGGVARASRTWSRGKAVAIAPDGGVLVATRYLSETADGQPSASADLHNAPLNPVWAQLAIGGAVTEVARLDPRGKLDAGFGSKGRVRVRDPKSLGLSPAAIRVDAGGAITVTGLRQQPKLDGETGAAFLGESRVFELHLDAKGGRDARAGAQGIVVSGEAGVVARAMIGRTPDGGVIVVTGARAPDGLAKLDAKLALDAAWGTTGRVAIPLAEDAFEEWTGAIAPSGAVLVVDHAHPQRLVGLGANGKADAALTKADFDGPWAIAARADGGVLGFDRDGTARAWPASALDQHVLAHAPGAELSGAPRFDRRGRLLAPWRADDALVVGRYVLPK
jgi:hypothetical protein